MRTVGVREFKTSASRILKQVREKGEEVEVTYRGRVVARVVPVVAPKASPRAAASVWADLDRLAAEIGARWPKKVTAVDAVREGRREL
jgi:prevent-host-death family protein